MRRSLPAARRLFWLESGRQALQSKVLLSFRKMVGNHFLRNFAPLPRGRGERGEGAGVKHLRKFQ
jgi:hypothetical protein